MDSFARLSLVAAFASVLGAAGALAAGHRFVVREDAATARAPAVPACRAVILGGLEHGDDVRAAARGCGDAWAIAHAAFAEGDFAEASTAFATASAHDERLLPSLTEIEAHLFAHDFARAAATGERMRHALLPPAVRDDLACAVDLLQWRSTHREEKRDVDPHGPSLRADLRYRAICAPRPFLTFARDLEAEGTFSEYGEWRVPYGWRCGNGPHPAIRHDHRPRAALEPIAALDVRPRGLRERLTGRPVGIDRRTLEALPITERLAVPAASDSTRFPTRRDLIRDRSGSRTDDVVEVSSMAAELALFYAFSGFAERAAPLWPILDRVADLLGRRHFGPHEKTWVLEDDELDDHDLYRGSLTVAATAAAVAGDAARAKIYKDAAAAAVSQLAGARVLRPQREELRWSTSPGSGEADWAILEAGDSGDGEAVVAALVKWWMDGREILGELLPRVTRNRGALDAWFRGDDYPKRCVACGASRLQAWLVDRREIARLLGDTATREALRPVAARFTDALTDPAIAFELESFETLFR